MKKLNLQNQNRKGRAYVLFILIASVVGLKSCYSVDEKSESGLQDHLQKSDCGRMKGYANLDSTRISLKEGRLRLRIGVSKPNGKHTADFIYFHGFGDCVANHKPLFDRMNENGIRVIGFDLPSHGDTCGAKSSLDSYSFKELAKMASAVESNTSNGSKVPLFIGGWSTGGLIASTIMQKAGYASFTRPVKGLVFIAPGVSVQNFVGEKGFITQETLTSHPNPPHVCPIKPKTPFATPVFAGRLKTMSYESYLKPLPAVPTLLLIAGDKTDHYVKSANLKKWAQKQRKKIGSHLTAIQCPDSFHEMDNEPEPIGGFVRSKVSDFISSVAAEKEISDSSGPCNLL